MGDMGDEYRDYREYKRELRERLGVNCPKCADRAILTRAKRKARKAGLRWNEACAHLWNRCKRIAIERAGGI